MYFGIYALGTGSGRLIYNNIIYTSVGNGIRLAGTNTAAYNNTVYNNTAGGIGVWVQSDCTNCIVQNNIAYLNSTNYQNDGSGTTHSFNLEGTNPNFTSPGTGDFTLTAASLAAIDVGTDLSGTFGTDFIGLARPIGLAWDVGAYEFNQH